MKKSALFSVIALAVFSSSCVSSKIHKELQAKYQQLQEENQSLDAQNAELQAERDECEDALSKTQSELKAVRTARQDCADKLAGLESRYQELNKSYEFLLESNNQLMANNQEENKKMMARLSKLQQELGVKEDSLRTEKRRLERLSAALQEREARVNELESAIAEKDSVVQAVRSRLKDALLNFDGKGLTVEIKDGKVYVSLENRLLFESASWDVAKEGEKALKQLAQVLGENPDLQVMVEGHTDADAYRGRGAVKDNWDLSVMRATSIVKILTENEEVNRANIIAAGRSEYVPVASNKTPEGKAKNRRTEIIITPDLGELNALLEETD